MDTDDEAWSTPSGTRQLADRLLRSGCRFFVCWGTKSEAVHDLIDDAVIEGDYQGVVTTFHPDETRKETAQFFLSQVDNGAEGLLAWVAQVEKWRSLLFL